MSQFIDHYKTLQVDPQAEPEVIRAAYRTLARKYHPDLVQGSEDRMRQLNDAWAVLGDPPGRATYDRQRALIAAREAVKASHETSSGFQMPVAPPRGVSGIVLDFGRYEGWSLGELARHDPDYLEWLARSPGGRRYRNEIDATLASRSGPVATAESRPDNRRLHRR